MNAESTFWKKCSRCKKEISFKATYYICDVSTCNSKRTGYTFCSLNCWESHLPFARHRDASAIEKQAPSAAEVAAPASAKVATKVFEEERSSSPSSAPTSATPAAGVRRIVRKAPESTGSAGKSMPISTAPVDHEVLIVASKLKSFIKACSDMNTSSGVMDVLSDKVRELCLEAIENAREEGRKTVLDRDFKRR